MIYLAFCMLVISFKHYCDVTMLRPLTDHTEVLTDHIGILKYSNRQKVIYTLYCEIETKFLFL